MLVILPLRGACDVIDILARFKDHYSYSPSKFKV